MRSTSVNNCQIHFGCYNATNNKAWRCLGQLGVAWVHLGHIKYISIYGACLACSKVDR